ncbi:C163A protein, partial [Amia calva]|nr:C163A protein [Amia calva]
VRLSNPCSGRVQVQFEGQWGPVCSHSWDLHDAEVLCQQLGCGAAVAAPHLLHPTYASEDRVLSRVGCLGNETELGECRAGPLGAKDCQHPWDAAVICAESRRLQIATVLNSCAGRVDVYHRGQRGTVCSNGFGLQEAHVVCRQAGCGEAETVSRFRFPISDVPIWLDRVRCSGNESSLWECASDPWGHHDCDLSMNVHIVCKGALNFSLENGNSPCAGRIQLKTSDASITFYDGIINNNLANVLCKEVGCGSISTVKTDAYFGTVALTVWDLPIDCKGNESFSWQCYAVFEPVRQWKPSASDFAGVVCSVCSSCSQCGLIPLSAHREPRIVGGEQPCSGRVELQFGDQWGTLCDSDWDLQDGSVVCRQLQCGEAVAIPGGAHYGEGRGPIWDQQLDCRGNESTVFECPISTKKGPNCTHRNDASVICTGQGGPRLVGGESRCSGRVEVLRGALWGSVCDRHLDLQTADVICRHLQCGGAAATPRGAPYGAGSGPLWKDRFQCSGSEGHLGECPLSWDQEDCGQGSVASVVCSDADWQVRLRGTDSRCEGRLEVLWNGSWGRVLDSQWDLQDASAVCTNLHCGRALLASNSTEYGHGDGPVVLTAVECTGQEPAVHNCTLTLSSGPGSTSGGVGVRCSEHWRLRLAGGGSQCAGRVEVYHGGAWGSVCDDLWDLADASVVCRQLGCGQALRATGSAEFGGGSGPIWLDDVSCRGNETALWDCPRASWERRNCRHKEDAGVVCSEHKELRLVSAEHHCAGRLDVLYNGTWGSVCSNGMKTFTVALVCQQLQCGDSGSLQDGEQYEMGSGPKWLDRVDCQGHESVLWQCPAAPWGHNDCQDSEVAHIQWLRLRLVGAEGRCSGRVEVCLRGGWGTVCDDSWDLQDARVVCRELGCGSALSALQGAHWGEGNGTLWLDEVSCRGTERALLECRSSPPGSHDCTHKEDAAVLCTGTLWTRGWRPFGSPSV